MKRAVDVLRNQGIVVRNIRYTRPPRTVSNYTREMVVRVDGDEKNLTLVVALFPDLKM